MKGSLITNHKFFSRILQTSGRSNEFVTWVEIKKQRDIQAKKFDIHFYFRTEKIVLFLTLYFASSIPIFQFPRKSVDLSNDRKRS